MFREMLEIAMLLGLVGGLFFVKHAFDKEKQERRNQEGDIRHE